MPDNANLTEVTNSRSEQDTTELRKTIEEAALRLGFDAIGFSDIELNDHQVYLDKWIANGFHGEMDYMHKHGTKRSRPEELVENTRSVISVRMDYLPEDRESAEAILNQSDTAYISRYALGRDYHKLMRNRLQKLAKEVEKMVGEYGYRAFTDSAPVLEKALAEKAGLGWIGKHTNLIQEKTGSWFFIGEIYTDLALAEPKPATNHCGSCTACIDVCPTQAIVAPYQVDARLCISYLTIELKDAIPKELRSQIGNRIYGCDDCQLVCPWNKFAKLTKEPDFAPRAHLTNRKLLELFAWTEEEFLKNTEGNAIRRIGHERWLRNIAVGLGNADYSIDIINALQKKRPSVSELVGEHIDWAIQAQHNKQEAIK